MEDPLGVAVVVESPRRITQQQVVDAREEFPVAETLGLRDVKFERKADREEPEELVITGVRVFVVVGEAEPGAHGNADRDFGVEVFAERPTRRDLETKEHAVVGPAVGLPVGFHRDRQRGREREPVEQQIAVVEREGERHFLERLESVVRAGVPDVVNAEGEAVDLGTKTDKRIELVELRHYAVCGHRAGRAVVRTGPYAERAEQIELLAVVQQRVDRHPRLQDEAARLLQDAPEEILVGHRQIEGKTEPLPRGSFKLRLLSSTLKQRFVGPNRARNPNDRADRTYDEHSTGQRNPAPNPT